MMKFIALMTAVVTAIMIFAIHRVFTDVPMDSIGLWLYGSGIASFVFFVVYNIFNDNEK